MQPIDKITIAVTDVEKALAFYAAVFGIKFKTFNIEGNVLCSGLLGTINIVLCPKSFAGIKASENTIQLRFVVNDIKQAIETGKKYSGEIINEIFQEDNEYYAALRDPDGNSLELIQKE